MLLKLIAHAGDRAGAVTRLDGALRRLVVLGTGTNQAFLRDIIRSPAFNGVLTTLFIPENFPGGWEAPVPPMSVLAAVAVAMALQCRADIVQAAPGAWGTLAGFRTATRAGLQARCRMQLQPPTGDPVTLDVVATPDGPRAMLDGALLPLPSEPAILQLADGSAHVASDGASWVIAALPLVQALGRKQSRDQASGSNIVAAMPGVVAKVLVVLGQVVRRGDVVVVQEAMKLMMPLAASLDGTVRAVHCVPGQIVAGGRAPGRDRTSGRVGRRAGRATHQQAASPGLRRLALLVHHRESQANHAAVVLLGRARLGHGNFSVQGVTGANRRLELHCTDSRAMTVPSMRSNRDARPNARPMPNGAMCDTGAELGRCGELGIRMNRVVVTRQPRKGADIGLRNGATRRTERRVYGELPRNSDPLCAS